MTLEAQYKKYLRENSDSIFTFDEWKGWYGNQLEQSILKMMQKQALTEMMHDDEESGLYDDTTQRLEKYSERFDNDKSPIGNPETWGKRLVEDNNPYIEPFLLRNGFKKQKNNSYDNLKCIITVLDGYYQIDWNHVKYGEISTYTDSYSILHLVGILTWNGLIDRNYKK